MFDLTDQSECIRPNLCHPDGRKSCAACCGLYNVQDGTRAFTMARIEAGTVAFRAVPREPDPIAEFAAMVRANAKVQPLDPVIHVCEFTGFMDPGRLTVGCMLHPSAPGNRGIDLRGLCYYGSMACRGFLCPATEELEPYRARILIDLLDDWHLYGLVITDVDFVDSVFEIVEALNGAPLVDVPLPGSPAGNALSEMLSWKEAWPPGAGSTVRRSRYHFKGSPEPCPSDPQAHIDRIAECLEYAFQGRSADGASDPCAFQRIRFPGGGAF